MKRGRVGRWSPDLLAGHGFTVHDDPSRRCGVAVAALVEHRAVGPGGDAQAQCHRALGRPQYAYGHQAVVRVGGVDLDLDGAPVPQFGADPSAGVLQHGQLPLPRGGEVAVPGGQGAGDIGGAARHVEPRGRSSRRAAVMWTSSLPNAT
nr:hypothetical protein [Streptomyces sp. B15]